jgi:hypothetical protein
VEWQTVRVQGAGRSVRYRNEQSFTNILEKEISVDPVRAPDASQDEAKGDPIADLPALPAGEYLAEVKAEDTNGQPVISSLAFHVAGVAEMGRLRPGPDGGNPGGSPVQRHRAGDRGT